MSPVSPVVVATKSNAVELPKSALPMLNVATPLLKDAVKLAGAGLTVLNCEPSHLSSSS